MNHKLIYDADYNYCCSDTIASAWAIVAMHVSVLVPSFELPKVMLKEISLVPSAVILHSGLVASVFFCPTRNSIVNTNTTVIYERCH